MIHHPKDIERANVRLEQALEIAYKYNDTEYEQSANQELDVLHGADLIYEALKQGIKKSELKAEVESHYKLITDPAKSILEFIVYDGIRKFSSSLK